MCLCAAGGSDDGGASTWPVIWMIVGTVFVVAALTTLVVIAALLVRRHNNAQRHRRDVERHILDELLGGTSSAGSDSGFVRASGLFKGPPAPTACTAGCARNK